MKSCAYEEIKAAQWGLGVKAPRLKALAAFIEQHMGNMFDVVVDEGTYTPVGPKVGRIRVKTCKTYYGTRVRVYRKGCSIPAMEHNAAKYFLRNSDLCRWIVQNVDDTEAPQ